MHFVAASSLRQPRAWKAIRSGKAVVTNRGKPMALVLPITDATFETVVEQISQIEASAAVRAMQAQAKAGGVDGMTDEQIGAVIADARKRRHARRR